jgi:CubicO group peptidase (beta-lactamase class C family)
MSRLIRSGLIVLATFGIALGAFAGIALGSGATSRSSDPVALPESGLPMALPEEVGMSAERLARIAPVMQRYIDDRLVAGTVTLVARKGRVVHFEAQGLMDADAGVPMRRDALFRIASMTKPITSVALMMLWEEGRFQLDEPVERYLPEFADVRVSTTADASGRTGELVPPRSRMTIRQLLTHTAGLANSYRGNTEFYGETMDGPAGEEDLEAYVKRLAAMPLNYHPGEEWQYSGATDVVGRLVEVISGMPLDRFLAERIFIPLRMPDTHFFLDDSHGERLTAQYTPGPDQKISLQDPAGAASRWISGPRTLFRGAGGLVSTASDYVRFQQAMLNGGELDGVRILGPRTVSLMLENHTGDLPLWLPGPGYGFGLGWAVAMDRGKSRAPFSVGTGYWGGAYATLSWFDAEQELIGVVMTQVRPYGHINLRQDFQVLAYQAIVD